MKCKETYSRLSQYIDDQLDVTAAAEIKRHLEECDECRQYYKRLQALAGMADQFNLKADETYWESRKNSVVEKIEKVEGSNIEVVKPKRSHDIWYRFSAVAAVIALVAFISVYESMDVEETKGLFKKQYPPSVREAVPSNSSEFLIEDEEVDELQDIPVTEPAYMKSEEFKDSELEPMAEKSVTTEISMRVVNLEEVDLDERENQQKESKKSEIKSDIVLEATSDQFIEHTDLIEEIVDEEVGIESIIKSGKRNKGKSTIIQPMKRLGDKAQYRTEISMSAPSTPEPVEAGEQKYYEEALMAEPEPEDRMMLAFDVENPPVGLIGSELDPDLFAEFSDEEKLHYMTVKQRVENLNSVYGYLLSPHEEEIAAKRKSSFNDDSIDVITAEMAEAYHELGMLTPDEIEQSNILGWLNKLLKIVDKELLQKIKEFISNIENKSP